MYSMWIPTYGENHVTSRRRNGSPTLVEDPLYVCCTPIHISTYIHTTYIPNQCVCIYVSVSIYLYIYVYFSCNGRPTFHLAVSSNRRWNLNRIEVFSTKTFP